jgi:pyrroline-5-carboxylate reductase
VVSPGGTTAAGLVSLEESGFRAALINAVKEAANRSREMMDS